MKLLNVVISAVQNNGRLLLIKRKKPPYVGYWGLPGGKLEFGEHVDEAAVREIEEETGIRPDFRGIRGIASEIVHTKGDKTAHFLLYVCEMETEQEEFTESEREGALKWFDMQDIDKEKDSIIPSDMLMIREFLLGEKRDIPVHKVKMIEDGDNYYVEAFHL
jgi:ADP-ribose pyrophosphatase YjhB (NUDIX family)